MPAPLYYVYTKRHAVFVIKFNCFVYDSYLPIRLPRVVKCVTSGDVASGVAKCDPRSIWNPRKNCGSFVDVYIVYRSRHTPSAIGLAHTCQIASSTSESKPAYRRRSSCDTLSRRDQFLARYRFCYILPILPSWLSLTVFLCTCMLMTLKYTALVRRQLLINYSCACRPVLTTLPAGCHPVGYSLTPPRQSSYGAHQLDDRISCQLHQFECAATT